jgi:methionyl aminopeptidase
MVTYKTDEEVELLRKSNLLVSKTLAEIAKYVKPGTTTLFIDAKAEEYIRDNGGVPGFKGLYGFPNTLCTSVNSEVVHGIPSKYELLDGDILSVDCGAVLNEFHGDSAYTFTVGEVSEEVKKLLQVTKESLYLGVESAIEGNRLGDVGFAIQSYVEKFGYSVVREMVGHGIGRKLHEGPEVPNYGKRGSGMTLKSNLVICIEPMINMGGKAIKQDSDGWTIRTCDGKPSAHFEFAVAVRKNKVDILSTFSFIEQELQKANN